MVTITEAARDKVLEILKDGDRHGVALRVAITGRGRGPGGFGYELELVEEDEKAPDDLVIDAGGFKIVVDAMSAPKLEGAVVDYLDDPMDSGFKIENPNSFFEDPVAMKVQQVLDDQINPAVADHGGFVMLLDVKDETAYIQLGGGCQGCGMVDVTLKQGIEVRIKEAVPAIREIIDSTDHAGGKNPYFQPAKGGRSPF
jgi:Fe/S biogenesis protein NfuA